MPTISANQPGISDSHARGESGQLPILWTCMLWRCQYSSLWD